MYVAKVYLNNQLVNINHYKDYEHFLSDLISADMDLVCYLPEEKISETRFSHPAIVKCDFEYRYDSGVTVYCRTVHAAEECAKTLDETIIELERYRQFEEIFRSKMTDAACDFLKDKKEFAKWLDQNKEIAEKYDKYAEAEKQGKLLKLPCAFGDTVYVKMQSGGYAEGKVRDFAYFHTCGFCVVITSEYFDKQSIPFSEFGKTIFLTKP